MTCRLSSQSNEKIIAELALNDDSENVRRAALIKLASYQAWLLHSQENSMVKIKQYASKKVAAILTEQDEIKLSEQEKLHYIASYNHYSLYEEWLKITDDSHLTIALFEKLAQKTNTNNQHSKLAFKPQLLINLFSQKQNIDVQQYIIDKVEDLDTLEKLKKKSVQVEINTAAG